MRLQDVGEQCFADAVGAVHGRRIDEVDTGVEGRVQEALLVVDHAPPVARERPHTEPDFGNLEIGLAEAAVAHERIDLLEDGTGGDPAVVPR